MTISLPPELDRILNEKLTSGQYGSVEEVLTAAFRALSDEEETIAAINEGNDDYLAGRIITLEESNTEFAKKYGISSRE